MTETQVKDRWAKLLLELHAALSGVEPRPRSVPSILMALEAVRLDPDAKGLDLSRPCAWLSEWRAFPTKGPSDLEYERREWADSGQIPLTSEDKRRHTMQQRAEEAGREYEAARNERWKREASEAAGQNTPITRQSLAR